MASKSIITYLQMRYIEVITLLLSSWDIQVGCLSQKERRNQCTKHQFSENIRQFQVLKMHALFECWRHFQKELDMLRTLAKRFLGSFVLIMDCANAFLAQGCEECKVLVQETAFATAKSIRFSCCDFVVASIWFLRWSQLRKWKIPWVFVHNKLYGKGI